MRSIQVVGQQTLSRFVRHFFLLSIALLSGAAGIAAQDSVARPVARLVGVFTGERPVSSASASPTKTKNGAGQLAGNSSLPPSVAPPNFTPPQAQTELAKPAEEAGVAEPVLTPGRAEMALRVFTLVNEARVKQGLSLLVWDEKAARMANSHAGSMAVLQFLNHVDPQGRDARMRARAAGISSWRALSENIAYNKGYEQPADFAVERWLLSAGHRTNILTATFTHTAVGVAAAADGRIYFTQVFLTR